VGFIVFLKCVLKKTSVFLVGSNYINTEDSYGRLIDFLNQYSKLIFQRAWFSWFYNASLVSRFVFLCKYSRTFMVEICVLFRTSWIIGSSDGLIITAQTSPYLFCPSSSCTYNSHVIKTKVFLRTLCSFSILVWFSKFQTVNPGFPPSLSHTFWSTAIRRDNRAALYFCSCELPWRSIECVLLPVLAHCRIFL